VRKTGLAVRRYTDGPLFEIIIAVLIAVALVGLAVVILISALGRDNHSSSYTPTYTSTYYLRNGTPPAPPKITTTYTAPKVTQYKKVR